MPDVPAGPGRDRLLVVEDDAAQRVGLQQLLTSWGFAVEVAIDGREALERSPHGPSDDRAERSGHAEPGRPRSASALKQDDPTSR